QCFLSRNAKMRATETKVLEDAVRHHNQKVIGWRDVPVDVRQLGPVARSTMPVLRQLFIGRMCPVPAFERTLFMIRKRASRRATEAGVEGFYIASLSSRTVVYKGLSLPERLDSFYLDLREEETKSKFALVHSRFSTNTFPTWERAHPYRRIAHNGEINTLRGNQTWMRAREALLESAAFGEHLADFKPIIRPGGSDSASLDNVVDFLVAGGRSLPHVMMMLVPGAWEGGAVRPGGGSSGSSTSSPTTSSRRGASSRAACCSSTSFAAASWATKKSSARSPRTSRTRSGSRGTRSTFARCPRRRRSPRCPRSSGGGSSARSGTRAKTYVSCSPRWRSTAKSRRAAWGPPRRSRC